MSPPDPTASREPSADDDDLIDALIDAQDVNNAGFYTTRDDQRRAAHRALADRLVALRRERDAFKVERDAKGKVIAACAEEYGLLSARCAALSAQVEMLIKSGNSLLACFEMLGGDYFHRKAPCSPSSEVNEACEDLEASISMTQREGLAAAAAHDAAIRLEGADACLARLLVIRQEWADLQSNYENRQRGGESMDAAIDVALREKMAYESAIGVIQGVVRALAAAAPEEKP